jgi:AcrR family transcriptional regulator
MTQSKKRDMLLNTAEQLFYEQGFHATGIDLIVNKAGVTRMTLYNHFGSKTELIHAVLEARYARYCQELKAALESQNARSALSGMIEVHENWLRDHAHHGCIVIKAIAEFEKHHQPIAKEALALKHNLLQIINQALARDGYKQQGSAEKVLMILEGANALVPVIGVESSIASMWALLKPWVG